MLKVTRCEFVHNLPCEQVSNRLTDLEAENAKLRELAAQALQIIKHVNVVMAVDWSRYSTVMSMARELGIEVD